MKDDEYRSCDFDYEPLVVLQCARVQRSGLLEASRAESLHRGSLWVTVMRDNV
jgi:hypothetical protein